MKITIPTDFSQSLVEAIEKENSNSESRMKVGEVYGSLPVSIIGSLRPASTLPKVSVRELRHHIELLASTQINFNYTLNSSWLANIEATIGGRDAIISHLSELVQAGVKRFTIALPFLARLVKRHWPEVAVSASIVANITDLHCLQRWIDYGVDRVVVPREKTRDFSYLSKIVNHTDIAVEVLASSPCLLGCPDTSYHGLISSLQSQAQQEKADCVDVTNYGRLDCHRYALQHPEEFVKMPWVRPEDAILYERIGVGFLKLDGRDKNRNYNLFRVKHYCREKYDGNWLHMLLPEYPQSRNGFMSSQPNASYLAYLDNRELDGFVEVVWLSGRCPQLCSICGICKQKAQEVLLFNEEWREDLLEHIEIEQLLFIENQEAVDEAG